MRGYSSAKRKIIPIARCLRSLLSILHTQPSFPFAVRLPRHATFSNYRPIRELSVEPEMRNEGNRPSFSADYRFFFSLFFKYSPSNEGTTNPAILPSFFLLASAQAGRKCDEFTRAQSSAVNSNYFTIHELDRYSCGKSNKITPCL